MNRWGKKKAPYAGANYSIANYLDKFKAMVTRILDMLIENAANNSKIVATEIIDDILKGAVRLTIIQRKRETFSHRQNFCHLERKISMAM